MAALFRLCITGFFAALYLGICQGTVILGDKFIGISLTPFGGCPDTADIACRCGTSQQNVTVTLPVCNDGIFLVKKCKVCDDLTYDDVCPQYRNCKQCSHNGEQCDSCPATKYGQWCENDCTCSNGGSCTQNGDCLCPEGFEGKRCRRKSGCKRPKGIARPLSVSLNPQNAPITAVYSCPQDYELKGQPISTCSSNKEWSSPPPKCLRKCPMLSSPTNGQLIFSENQLVEGTTAVISCNPNYRLVGNKTLSCLENGEWDARLPICDELATCQDPGTVQNAQRIVPSKSEMYGGQFLQRAEIHFKCFDKFEQIGTEMIRCKRDGTWSDKLPFCLIVSKIVPDCNTLGSHIISDVGTSVRILCPPECADKDANVWGTSIYQTKSSVCQAAIHSGKITNSGGIVDVINNGFYTHFTGSVSNDIVSQSNPGRDGSMLFQKLPILTQERGSKECPQGMEKLNSLCAYISRGFHSRQEAEAICSNLGMQLHLPESKDEQFRLIKSLKAKGITSIWSNTASPRESNTMCKTATIGDNDFRAGQRDCNQQLNFVCTKMPGVSHIASCEDPGEFPIGELEPKGQVEGIYYVGSSIRYSCPALHYLDGEEVISCKANGKWSSGKPKCVEVLVCQKPPLPQGGQVIFHPPASSERNFPGGSTATSTRKSFVLPPGAHRVGTRAEYYCESKYYELTGSNSRTCQSDSTWSGRPANCLPICGRSDSPRSPFIVNGNTTEIGQWPWQVALARNDNDEGDWDVQCGGSLLVEDWVVTAAHCVTKQIGFSDIISKDNLKLYLGKYYRKDYKDDKEVQVRKVKKLIIHPEYDPVSMDSDIALLQLDFPVKLSNRVSPVCLPTERTAKENLVPGKKGVVTGWGLNENKTMSDTLKQAVLPVISNQMCEQHYEESNFRLTVSDNMFCAGYVEGVFDACSGDSGGPLVFLQENGKDKRWILEGLVSWGSPEGCGFGKQYSAFTTVSKYLSWIQQYF